MADQEQDEGNWYSEDAATFGDRMVGARELVGLSQKALARNLGVKLKTIQAWENDVSEPRANKLQMLSGILNVSLMWLLTGQGEGIDAPEAGQPISPEIRAVLAEMRQLRVQINSAGERLARLEKALRTSLQERDG